CEGWSKPGFRRLLLRIAGGRRAGPRAAAGTRQAGLGQARPCSLRQAPGRRGSGQALSLRRLLPGPHCPPPHPPPPPPPPPRPPRLHRVTPRALRVRVPGLPAPGERRQPGGTERDGLLEPPREIRHGAGLVLEGPR